MPTTQLSANERQAVAIRLPEVSTLKMITGLNTFSSRWPVAPATDTATWLPITCAATMVSASAWVGLTLPGMIDEPGSFSGRASSPRPERGPEPSRRISLPIFISEQAITLRSEEHTSELQSLMRISYAVFCLKKKKKHKYITNPHTSYH